MAGNGNTRCLLSLAKPLGLVLEDGDDYGVCVQRIAPDGHAHLDGKVSIGDRVISVNGRDVTSMEMEDVLGVIAKVQGRVMIMFERNLRPQESLPRSKSFSPNNASNGLPLLSGDDIFAQEPLHWLPKEHMMTNPSNPMYNQYSWLPTRKLGWTAYEHKVAVLMNNWNGTPMQVVCGPAVKWARTANAVLWTFWLFLPFGNAMITGCPCAEKLAGGALPQANPIVWVVFAMVLVYSLYCEMCVIKYVIPVQVWSAPHFKLGPIDFRKFPYVVWRLYVLCLSATSKTSIVSNSLFMANLWTSTSCGRAAGVGGAYDKLWDQVMAESTIASIPLVGQLSFTHGAMVAWSLMGLQIIFTLIYTVPLRPVGKNVAGLSISYDVPANQEEARGMCFQYETLGDDAQNHGAAVMLLADSARMMGPAFQDKNYARAKMEHHLKRAQHDTSRSAANSVLHIGYQQMLHGVSTLLLVGVLDCTVQLNMQVSRLAMTRQLEHVDICLKTKVSLALNMFVFLMKLAGVSMTFTHYDSMRRQIPGMLKPFSGGNKEEQAADEAKLKKLWCLWRRVQLCYYRFLIYIIIYLVLFSYALAKFIAWGVCDSGMLNLNGCAEVTIR